MELRLMNQSKQFNALVNGLFHKDHMKVSAAFDKVMKQKIAPVIEQKQKQIAKTVFNKK